MRLGFSPVFRNLSLSQRSESEVSLEPAGPRLRWERAGVSAAFWLRGRLLDSLRHSVLICTVESHQMK